MTSSSSVGVMHPASAAAFASEEGGYVQLDSNPSVETKSSRFLVGASITAITLLLATIVSLPAYLLTRSSSSPSTRNSALPIDAHFVDPTTLSRNSSQYGLYPMLYEDPSNQWTPSAGFLFNLTTTDIDLQQVALSRYIGNITLVTNVASF